jgi:hypothetical protein
MRAAFFFIVLDISAACQAATVVDVSQLLVPTKNDYGDGSGQIFTPGINGNLEGISVYLIKAGGGADVVLTVYTLNDTVTAFKSVVGTATIKANLISAAGGWVYFAFPKTVSQTADVALAFTVKQPTSSASGYVNYGDNMTNPYSGGAFIHSSGLTFTRVPGTDLGFQTTVTPIPETGAALLVSITLSGMVVLRRRKG